MNNVFRSYSELSLLTSFEERFDYLSTSSRIGFSTFGYDRYLNQEFYSSREWRRVRDKVIIRDNGCDLGIEGFDINDRIIIHHMNPISLEDIEEFNPDILNPEYLISVSHRTHNAIHFGNKSDLPLLPIDRRPGDTKLW